MRIIFEFHKIKHDLKFIIRIHLIEIIGSASNVLGFKKQKLNVYNIQINGMG